MANYTANSENNLEGQGLEWTDGKTSTSLIYKVGNRLHLNGSLDLDASKAFKINNADVLTAKELGPGVIRSSLRQVGNLRSLIVNGDTNLGEFATFNSALNRLGINTDRPNATLSVLENNVEIALGAPVDGRAQIGTFTNHDLDLITDNTARVTITSDGEVVIGHERFNNGILRVNGTIFAKNIITDDKDGRANSVVFSQPGDVSVFGVGLAWRAKDLTRQLILRNGPERLWSSESFDLGEGKSYYLNGELAISPRAIGPNISQSNLTTLGTLENLSVGGASRFMGDIKAEFMTLKAVTINHAGILTVNNDGIRTSKDFKVTVDGLEDVKVGSQEIVIGHNQNVNRPLKLFGKVSIGVNSPDTSVDLEVKGPVSLNGKKFISASEHPSIGIYTKGDVCWNAEPHDGNYVGWICVVSGNPGTWLPFGAIGRHNS
jgi:hypothetical protein